MEIKGKGAGSQGYPPGGVWGSAPKCYRTKESANPQIPTKLTSITDSCSQPSFIYGIGRILSNDPGVHEVGTT